MMARNCLMYSCCPFHVLTPHSIDEKWQVVPGCASTVTDGWRMRCHANVPGKTNNRLIRASWYRPSVAIEVKQLEQLASQECHCTANSFHPVGHGVITLRTINCCIWSKKNERQINTKNAVKNNTLRIHQTTWKDFDKGISTSHYKCYLPIHYHCEWTEKTCVNQCSLIIMLWKTWIWFWILIVLTFIIFTPLKCFLVRFVYGKRLLVDAKRERVQLAFKFRHSLAFVSLTCYLLRYVYSLLVIPCQLSPSKVMHLVWQKQQKSMLLTWLYVWHDRSLWFKTFLSSSENKKFPLQLEVSSIRWNRRRLDYGSFWVLDG